MVRRINDKIIQELRDDPETAKAVLSSDFELFIKVFHYYTSRKQFTFKPFHYKIIDKLEAIAFGENEKPNTYIGMAPRYGKTTIMNYFVAFGYALNPFSNFIATSYGDDLVKKFSTTIRDIISCDLFGLIFGSHISKDTSAKELWKISGGGEFRASSLKGVITGFGAGMTPEDEMEDVEHPQDELSVCQRIDKELGTSRAGVASNNFGGALLIDDYLKASDYGSLVKKAEVTDVYENTLKSRRNNTEKTPIIIIAQRLAKDDLIGHIKETEADLWDFLEIETINEETGQCIWPEKHNGAQLERMKRVNPFLFYSQYQQNPIVMGGSVILSEWFRYYQLDTMVKYKKMFITGDTAQKVKQHNDYSVFCVWGITHGHRLQLIDMIRGKWEAPELLTNFLAFWNRWKRSDLGNVTSVYVEDKSSGTGLIQTIKRGGDGHRVWGAIPIIGYEIDADKLSRVEASLTYIEAGYVELPVSKEYGFVPDLISECEAFTRDDSHTHDDIVDNLTMGVDIGLANRNVSTLDVL